MTSTSAKPLGYYTNHTPGDAGILDQLQQRYGAQLQGVSRLGKLIFRASLAAYLVMRPIWNDEGNCISCADSSIASAGGDDHEIWSNDPEFVEYIRACCEQLSDSDLEGVIEALTSQLRYGG